MRSASKNQFECNVRVQGILIRLLKNSSYTRTVSIALRFDTSRKKLGTDDARSVSAFTRLPRNLSEEPAKILFNIINRCCLQYASICKQI